MSGKGRRKVGRIHRGEDIRSLRRAGKFLRGESVLAWASVGTAYGASGERGESRLGVTAGRGFAGAVERNRARRRVRGAVMDRRALLKPGRDYLVQCRPGAEARNYQELVKEIEDILSRI